MDLAGGNSDERGISSLLERCRMAKETPMPRSGGSSSIFLPPPCLVVHGFVNSGVRLSKEKVKSEVKSHWATYDRQELCGALHGTAGVASSAQDGLSDMVWNTFCIEFSPPWHEMTHMATVKPHAVGVETVSVPRRHHRCREPACKSESKSFSTAQGNDIFCFCVRSFCLRLSHFVPFVCVKVCMYSSVWECCFVLRCVSAAYLLSRSISLFSRSLSLSLCGCLALSRSLSLSLCL